MFACQLRVMEIKIVTTEVGAFGLIFGPGHWVKLNKKILNTWTFSTPWLGRGTLSLVCHGNSVHGNMAMDICILKNSIEQRILFNDEFFVRDLSEMVPMIVHLLPVSWRRWLSCCQYSHVTRTVYLLLCHDVGVWQSLLLSVSWHPWTCLRPWRTWVELPCLSLCWRRRTRSDSSGGCGVWEKRWTTSPIYS